MGLHIDKIISKYLRGELSDKEEMQLNQWLDKDPSHREQLKSLSDIWKTPLGYPGIVNMDDEQRKIWSRLSREENHYVPDSINPVSLTKNLLKYAAVLIIFLSLGYLFWNNFHSTPKKVRVVVETIERVNPLGQKSRIQLPDGSTVMLNAGSKLSYKTNFNGKTRKLHLEGEAYFEVMKNPKIPFEVYTNNLVVTALGTSFNINAFNNQQTEKIALNTGKVKIKLRNTTNANCVPSYLNPGDIALFNSKTGFISISKYTGLDPFGWKDGRIVFHHASFHEVLDVLSRWYNVEFEVIGNLKHEWDYSSTFQDEVLDNILGSLKFSENIEYKIDGSKIEIKL